MYQTDPLQDYRGPPRRSTIAPLLLVMIVIGVGAFVWLGRDRFLPLHDPDAAARTVTPRGDLADSEKTTIELFRRAAPSVVFITNLTVRTNPFSLDVVEAPQGTGSGFVWDDEGRIVTNYHVVERGKSFDVRFADNRAFKARLVGEDPTKDLAVLQVEKSALPVTPLPIGDSASLSVGQSVLAIGNPFGFDQTLTTGVISGLNRQIRSRARTPIRGVIQTDAAINPGNSGGPLLDSAGRVIGINTAIFSPSGAYAGIGFAVPIDTVNEIVPQIIRSGRPKKAALGIMALHEGIARRERIVGVAIEAVTPGGAAERAGLEGLSQEGGVTFLGDVIIGVGSDEIRNLDDLRVALAGRRVGETVTLTIRRNGQIRKVPVTLTEK